MGTRTLRAPGRTSPPASPVPAGPRDRRRKQRRKHRDDEPGDQEDAVRRIPERDHQQADDRIGEQDVAPPHEPRVGRADGQQDGQPPHVAADAILPAGRCALELQREAQAEQQRKQRDELDVHQPVHRLAGQGVEAVAWLLLWIEKLVQAQRYQVDHADAQQGEAAQCVDRIVPFRWRTRPESSFIVSPCIGIAPAARVSMRILRVYGRLGTPLMSVIAGRGRLQPAADLIAEEPDDACDRGGLHRKQRGPTRQQRLMQHAVREGAIERGRPENDEHERQEQQAAHRAPAAADRQLSPHHQQGRQGQRQRGQQRQPARAGPFDGIAGDSTNKAILVRRGAGDQGHQDLRNNTREGQRSEGQAEAEAARHRRLAPRHQCAGPQHRVREQWPDQIYDGRWRRCTRCRSARCRRRGLPSHRTAGAWRWRGPARGSPREARSTRPRIADSGQWA